MHSLDTAGITVPAAAAETTMRHQPIALAIHLMPTKPPIAGLTTVHLMVMGDLTVTGTRMVMGARMVMETAGIRATDTIRIDRLTLAMATAVTETHTLATVTGDTRLDLAATAG